MKRVHARKESDSLSWLKVDHTDGTFITGHISSKYISRDLLEKSSNSVFFCFVEFFSLFLCLSLSNYVVLIELIYVRTALFHH